MQRKLYCQKCQRYHYNRCSIKDSEWKQAESAMNVLMTRMKSAGSISMASVSAFLAASLGYTRSTRPLKLLWPPRR